MKRRSLQSINGRLEDIKSTITANVDTSDDWQPREPTPDEADAILQVLIDAGGLELAQTVIDYQLNGEYGNGDDSGN